MRLPPPTDASLVIMPLHDGATFAGFAIVRLLGSGRTGEVYLVQHPRLPRRQALRIFSAGLSADPQFRARFDHEADQAAALSHPHLVRVHNRGESDGRLWILTGYVDGTTAENRVAQLHPRGLPRIEALDIIEAIAEALDYAHGHGLLHLDVTPANILLSDPDGDHRRILLADLGIAHSARDTLHADSRYIAPERLAGLPVDGRADQYSLAATASHLLCGSPPFADPPSAATPRNIGDIHPRLADLQPALSRALAPDPAVRFARCRDLAAALRGNEPPRPTKPVPGATTTQPLAQHPGYSPAPAPPVNQQSVPAYPGPWPPPDHRWQPPPPQRRDRRRWALAAVASIAVLLFTATAIILVRNNFGDHSGIAASSTTSVGGASAPAVSANDTGPVTIVADDPTCQAWLSIALGWGKDPLATWLTNASGPSPLSVPANQWSAKQRAAAQASADSRMATAKKAATLATTTPHRVMRELYEQFIAYNRAFAGTVTGNYVPKNAFLYYTAGDVLQTLQSVCAAIRDGATIGLPAPTPSPANPARVAPPQDPDNPQRFVNAADAPACAQLAVAQGHYSDNPAVTQWLNLDHAIPATRWDPQQKAIYDAVTKVMFNLADEVERSVSGGNNPVMTDFGELFIRYERAYATELPHHVAGDVEIVMPAQNMLQTMTQACRLNGE